MAMEFNEAMFSDKANELHVAELSEFIKDKLYLMILSANKDSTTLQSFKDWKKTSNDNINVFYLNVDDSLVYDNFYSDFGPLNLAMIYRYIGMLRDKFKCYKKVIHCAGKGDKKKLANSAFLICAYMIIENNWTAQQAYSVLSQKHKYQYLPFRDASCLTYTEYSVTVEECVNALYKAKWFGFFDFSDFDVEEYEKFEMVKHGDINWIVPGTLLAFSSPHSREYTDKSGYQIHSPAFYYQYFKENNVKHVVRLNSKRTYDAKRTFVATASIQHTDLIFTDGTPPTDSILECFMNLCEQYIDDNSESNYSKNSVNKLNSVTTSVKDINNESHVTKCIGAVAVHCKAGLGRTGCLVASYILKHWSFTAVEAIAWTRICRPGSVIGVQQKWLIDKEMYLKTSGKQWREKRKQDINQFKRFTYGVYSIKRHSSNTNAYDYVDSPPMSHISKNEQYSFSNNSDGDEHLEEYNESKLPSAQKKKLKKNNFVLPDTQNDNIPVLRPRRYTLKNDGSKHSYSTVKNCRQITNSSVEVNVNNLVKKNNTNQTTLTIAKSNSKSPVIGKKITKAISLNKTSTISTRSSMTTESPPNSAIGSKPSYALATVASSARVSRRLRNQNCVIK